MQPPGGGAWASGRDPLYYSNAISYDFAKVNLSRDIVKRIQPALRMPDMVGGSIMK